MIHINVVRQLMLAATGGVFVFFAIWAAVKPRTLATTLGYELKTPNATSEFHAIYVGVFLAQALLCVMAVLRVQDAAIGDLVAVFVLSQPVGRVIAVLRKGLPSGLLLFLFMLELAAGTILLLLRPTA